MRDFTDVIAVIFGGVIILIIYWGMGVALWQSWRRREKDTLPPVGGIMRKRPEKHW